ncbi:Ark- serine/threonine protein kinase [Elasticomyces elasticus]|nr:Ark- serine/threonine protein kinase [Elasticomyces elasticus]
MATHHPFPPSTASTISHRAAAPRATMPVPSAPPGTFAPGTKVQVGNHRVVIEKYLSEGGFAHVYVVRVPRPSDTTKDDNAVLKRVAVPDKESLANMRTEVETMKKLKGHKHIVTYIDSHASQLKGGGYEVFLLMEHCAGGGLIDFMNTRLQNRLTEPEILHIFSDVAEGVACMHYLRPPLLHRDLKVENVLISVSTKSREMGSKLYKLCDFGSTAPPRPAATNVSEGRLIEEDVQRHTTLQYRSPEMIDIWRKRPIDEKSDIWALGVLLYKLCYYTTPFEELGQMAILNASFKYPSHPAFSTKLKALIGTMLREDPKQRPNIYQVVSEACRMRGKEVPIKDIYSTRTQSEARSNEHLPTSESPISSPPAAGLTKSPPPTKTEVLPTIAPMRRGRPTAPAIQAPIPKVNPSPARGDPFAALDSKSYEVRVAKADELSSKFPSLDEFALAHGTSGSFRFPQSSPAQTAAPESRKSMTDALADQAFTRLKTSAIAASQDARTSAVPSRATSLKKTEPLHVQPEAPSQPPLIHEPKSLRPGYTSQGTMTSPSPPQPLPELRHHSQAPSNPPDVSKRPIWRVPSYKHRRSSSTPSASDSAQAAADRLQPSLPLAQHTTISDIHRSKSQTATTSGAKSPTSSSLWLEGHGASSLDVAAAPTRAKSANERFRPKSVHAAADSNHLHRRETSLRRPSFELRPSTPHGTGEKDEAILEDRDGIETETSFLRAIEDEEGLMMKSSRNGSGHRKRASMPSNSLSGTKNIVMGKFGNAFRRFEVNTTTKDTLKIPAPPLTERGVETRASPSIDSEAMPDRSRDSGEELIEETEDLPPEMRREMERRRLSQEERRVAEAAAEYRNRISGNAGIAGGGSRPSKASTIQKRVQSLLEEGRQSPVLKKTAEGYGRFTDSSASDSDTPSVRSVRRPSDGRATPPVIAQKSPGIATTQGLPYAKTRQQQQPVNLTPPNVPLVSASAPPIQNRTGARPSAPPKPKALRTGNQNLHLAPSHQVAVPGLAPGSAVEDDGWEADFSQRFPTLTGIEMVETEIERVTGKVVRVKEV